MVTQENTKEMVIFHNNLLDPHQLWFLKIILLFVDEKGFRQITEKEIKQESGNDQAMSFVKILEKNGFVESELQSISSGNGGIERRYFLKEGCGAEITARLTIKPLKV